MTMQPWRIAVLAAATALALAACGGKEGEASQQQGTGAQKQMPAPMVSVVTVQPENVLLEMDLPGRLEAVRSAPIIPQVSGIVKRRLFQEGDMVRAGQPLYQLDDASYAANLESARASLASAQAALAKASADVALSAFGGCRCHQQTRMGRRSCRATLCPSASEICQRCD